MCIVNSLTLASSALKQYCFVDDKDLLHQECYIVKVDNFIVDIWNRVKENFGANKQKIQKRKGPEYPILSSFKQRAKSYKKECFRIEGLFSEECFWENTEFPNLMSRLILFAERSIDFADRESQNSIANIILSLVSNYDKISKNEKYKIKMILEFFVDDKHCTSEIKKSIIEQVILFDFDNNSYKSEILLLLSQKIYDRDLKQKINNKLFELF